MRDVCPSPQTGETAKRFQKRKGCGICIYVHDGPGPGSDILLWISPFLRVCMLASANHDIWVSLNPDDQPAQRVVLPDAALSPEALKKRVKEREKKRRQDERREAVQRASANNYNCRT